MIVETAVTRRPDWRAIAFRVVALLAALFVLLIMGGIFGLVAPWGGPGGEPTAAHPEMHRWHSTQWGALMAIMIGGSLLATLRRPRENPVLVQFVALALVAFFILQLFTIGFSGEALALPVIAALLVALFPEPRALARFAPTGALSTPLLAVTGVAALLLLPDALQSLQLQLTDPGEHAQLGHWTGSVAIAMWVALAGLLAATRRGGGRTLGTIAGIALFYLGAGALSIPSHDGSWGAVGGVLALLGGVAFIGVTLRGARATEGTTASIPAPA